MKTITATKMNRVEAPAEDKAVAYQLVRFVISFFGSETESVLDTAIYSDGRQVVIDGCGFIPAGYEL